MSRKSEQLDRVSFSQNPHRFSESRGLLRSVSIDTTCSGAASDGSGRSSCSMDGVSSVGGDEWTAVIVGAFDLCGNVRYLLQVRAPPRKWLIRKRYNDFLAFNAELAKCVGEAGLPTLPPKSYSLLGPSPEFLATRQRMLQHYLDMLAASRAPLRNHRVVRDFIRMARPEDRTAFTTDPATPPLPTDFPDAPPEDSWPSGVPLDVRREIAETAQRGAAALWKLYIFEQTLETDLSPDRQSITFDQSRTAVAQSVETLGQVLPRLEALCRDERLAGWAPLMEFDAECARVGGQALAWAAAFDTEEEAVLRRLLRDPQLVARGIGWYSARAAALVKEWKARLKEDQWSRPPEPINELYDMIAAEMKVRSRAYQTVSVQRLRDVLDEIRSGRMYLTVVRSCADSPIDTVVDALLRRAAGLSRSVERFIHTKELSHSDRTGLVYRLDQLVSDIAAATAEVETVYAQSLPPQNVEALRNSLASAQSIAEELYNDMSQKNPVQLDSAPPSDTPEIVVV